MAAKNFPKLHVYGQFNWHDHAFIVGDRAALESLKEAIDSALGEGNGKTEVFTSDGEGYHLCVYKEEDETYWDKSGLPYIEAECSLSQGRDIVSPWDLFKKYKKDK